jgi:large subunit ribosomal protein L4
MNVKIYNQEGQEIGSVELRPQVFEVGPNKAVVHQYIVNYRARQRQGSASTKTRREARGGGRKPWRQKGTGRARAGTIRSPLWRGGGTVFGPRPRGYGSKMPRRMKRLALVSLLSDKARAERIKVVDTLRLDEIRTKAVVGIFDRLELTDQKCLVLDEGKNEKLALSCRNLQTVNYAHAAIASGYDIINADWLVFTKAGLEKVHEVFG